MDYFYHNTTVDYSQPLQDEKSNGKAQPWAEHKSNTETLATAYDLIGNDRKGERLRQCAPRLHFAHTDEGKLKLKNAVFCRVRLCPVCQWRRSLKLFGQTKQVIDYIQSDKKAGWIMLTLTVRNVDPGELNAAITDINKAWDRLCKTKRFKDTVKGWQRCLEVTHNTDPDDTWFNTYHPHIHALLQVQPSYFKSRKYIPYAEWRSMWAAAARLDYDPQIWVKKVTGDSSAVIAEVTKYAAKPNDYVIPWDVDLMMDAVQTMDNALHRRRLVAFGGEMKKAHAALGLDDVDDGDLVHTDNDDTAAAEQALLSFSWVPGYRQYFKDI